jgi:hypothetical protein
VILDAVEKLEKCLRELPDPLWQATWVLGTKAR